MPGLLKNAVILELENSLNKPFGGFHFTVLNLAHNLTAIANFAAKIFLVQSQRLPDFYELRRIQHSVKICELVCEINVDNVKFTIFIPHKFN